MACLALAAPSQFAHLRTAYRPRENWPSTRVFTSYDNIVDHCAADWNKPVARPGRIMILGLRDWAIRSTGILVSRVVLGKAFVLI